MLHIKSVELIEINLPLVHFFETSFGRTYERRIILVRIEDADGGEGWGEVTCGETPGYSDEWTDSAWVTIEKILAPMVVGKEFGSAADVWDSMKWARGHRMSKAALETACWDLEAKKLGIPLWRHIGGVNREIECGVSIGIQESVEQLFEKIQTELDAGYGRIKIKIKRGWDYDVIKQVREKFGNILLMGDANSAYTLNDVDLLKRMDEFELMMFEQPLAHDDMLDHSKLQREIKTAICLDESVKSPEDARKAIELKAGRIINVKLGRVGGYTQAKQIEEICRTAGIPVWCGGMLESGIGRAHNIAMSTLAGFTLPGDVSASKRYWHEEIIEPAVEVSANGTITAPEAPGIGFEVCRDRIGKLIDRNVKLTQKVTSLVNSAETSLPWSNWFLWKAVEDGEADIPTASGVYEVRRYGAVSERLTIGKASNLFSRVRQALVRGKLPHSSGERIKADEKDLSTLEIRWAQTDRPAAVEEELHSRYKRQFQGKLPLHSKSTK